LSSFISEFVVLTLVHIRHGETSSTTIVRCEPQQRIVSTGAVQRDVFHCHVGQSLYIRVGVAAARELLRV